MQLKHRNSIFWMIVLFEILTILSQVNVFNVKQKF